MTDAELAALVDEVRTCPARRGELIALLDERHPLYQDRGRAAVVQRRGWVLAAFEPVGLPADAWPFVLEELDSGIDPYLIAAAARAVRGAATVPTDLAGALDRALARVRFSDDRVSFAHLGATAPRGGTTAVAELTATRAWLDARAVGDCCAAPSHQLAMTDDADRVALDDLELEDHDGRTARYRDLFHGRPSIVVFFYTRCENPRKCSLTVARLAGLQRRLDAAGLGGRVGTAAITYDPAYDRAERLRAYGAARGLRLDGDHRLLRAPGGIGPLRAGFELGAGFVGALVNRHRIELFVLDARGRIAGRFVRLAWDDDEVMARVAALVDEPAAPVAPPAPARTAGAALARTTLAVVPPLALALFPKCPLCWAAYLGALGVAGLDRIPYAPWLIPVLAALVVVNVAVAWRRAVGRGARAGFYATAAGAVVILAGGLGLGLPHAAPVGIALGFVGALLGTVGGPISRTRAPHRAPRSAPVRTGSDRARPWPSASARS